MNELPTTFGKYFLSERLATGGMAEIYLAKLIGPGGFEKQLIIKQILPQFSTQPQFVDMFVAEAKTLVSLTHGNIVPVYELGVVDGTYFIAMEYIDGPTLDAFIDAVLDRGDMLEPSTSAFICAEVLKGLDYAHRRGEGVIHRDLSPRNVMLSREGEVKLVDFGIAVALDQQRDTNDHQPSGPPSGSYPYMSPEQVRRASLTGQTDLFSAGVLLWEMLTGERLFRRDTAEATLLAVTDADIPAPSTRNPKVPPQLEVICMRALERDPDKRFGAAVEFLTAINRYLYSREAHETAVKLSKLIARYCPPVIHTPEPTTPASEPEANLQVGDSTKPIERTKPVERTRPVERAATGKPRAQTATFATNMQFEDVLANATPLFPIQALDAAEAAAEPREPAEAAEDSATDSAEAVAVTDPAHTAAVDRVVRSDRLWRNIAIVSVITSISVVAFFMTRSNRAAGGGPRAADAAPRIVLVNPDAAARAAADAGVAIHYDAAVPDAGKPDARRRADARIVVHHRVDAAAKPPHAFGSLRVGANPWGEVWLDNKRLGRTPNTWSVPVGKHTVLVKFPVAGHEQTRRFHVTIRKAKETSLGVVDFSSSP